jgi:hypothetical protein
LIIGAIICLVVLAGCFEIIRAAVSDWLTELPDLH